MKISSFFAIAFLVALAACGGANNAIPSASTHAASSGKIVTSTFIIKIPTPPPGAATSGRARPAYVSYRVQSVVISGTGVDAPGNSVTANVTPTSPGCNGTPTVCSIPVATNVGSNESFTVTAYASTGATGSVLSTGSVTVSVSAGTANTIAVPLDPILNFGPIAPPTNPSAVERVTAGPNGNIYFQADQLYVFSATSQAYAACAPAIQFLPEIVAGPDGNLWVSDFANSSIDKITVSGTSCGTPTVYGSGAIPNVSAMTVGSDGKIWFGTSAAEIGTVTTSGAVTNVTTADNAPNQMILGGDGNVWFSTTTGEIEKVTPSGAITVVASGVSPTSIVLGSDGNVWFSTPSTIGKITPAGTTTTYAQSTPVSGAGLALGPDGQIWFVNDLGIAEITTSGVVTTYTGWGGFYYSGSLAFGGDENLYFGASADLDEFVR